VVRRPGATNAVRPVPPPPPLAKWKTTGKQQQTQRHILHTIQNNMLLEKRFHSEHMDEYCKAIQQLKSEIFPRRVGRDPRPSWKRHSPGSQKHTWVETDTPGYVFCSTFVATRRVYMKRHGLKLELRMLKGKKNLRAWATLAAQTNTHTLDPPRPWSTHSVYTLCTCIAWIWRCYFENLEGTGGFSEFHESAHE